MPGHSVIATRFEKIFRRFSPTLHHGMVSLSMLLRAWVGFQLWRTRQSTGPCNPSKILRCQPTPAVGPNRILIALSLRNGIKPTFDRVPMQNLTFWFAVSTLTSSDCPRRRDDVDTFHRDGIERTTEKLLASPRFGEKWARHWLDLARYAESNGADRNVVFPYAWRYRNWVIDAFNVDMPYNRFIREQVAGDLLSEPGDSQLVATGFLTLGPKSFQEQDREKISLGHGG